MALRLQTWALSGAAGLVAALLLPPAPAYAAAPGLSISVPAATSFGSFPAGARAITANLGPITVTTSSALAHDASWVATVAATSFRTGGGTAAETVELASVSYRSGSATGSTGLAAGACLPGQLTSVSLSTSRTAFSCTGLSLLPSTSLSWNPEIKIVVGGSNVVGTYSGTITHSVA